MPYQFLLFASFGALIASVTTPVFAQDEEPEVWYAWIDAQAVIESKPTRIVSDAAFAITCCIKSPDYTRLEKAAAQWIRDNYDEAYEGRISLKKIQDSDLANSVISWAKRDAEKGEDVLIVRYEDTCVPSS